MSKGGLWLALLLALLAPVVPAIMLAASMTAFSQINDLPEYCAAARLAADGRGAGIYDFKTLTDKERELFPSMGERKVGFYMPPLALPWLMPLASLPTREAPVIWFALLLAATIASLAVLKKLFGLTSNKVLWLWAVVSVSGPLYESLRIGQPAPLLLLALCLAVWALHERRPLPAALAMSFLLLKPQALAPLVVYLLGARRYRPLIYLAILGVVLTGISVAVVGLQGVQNYDQLMRWSMQNTAYMQPELNSTVRGQLLRFFPDGKQAVMIVSFVACVAVLLLIWLLGRNYMRYRQWLEIGLVTAMPIGLVTSLHTHDYDLLLLIPSVVSLLSLGIGGALPVWSRLAGMLGLTILLLPLYIYIHYDYLLPGGLVNPFFLYLLAASVLFIWLVHHCRLDLLLNEQNETETAGAN